MIAEEARVKTGKLGKVDEALRVQLAEGNFECFCGG